MVYSIFFSTFLFLSVFHVPLIPGPSKDFIGGFDFLTLLLGAYIWFTWKRKAARTMFAETPASRIILWYLVFTTYIVIKELILVPSLPLYRNAYGMALAVKQVQYLFIFIICLYSFILCPEVTRRFHIIMIVNILTILLYGAYMLFVTKRWYRLGVPFKRGVSSNPAGMALAVLMLGILYHYANNSATLNLRQKTVELVGLGGGLLALFFTDSRTNAILFLLFSAMLLLVLLRRSRRAFFIGIPSVLIVLTLLASYYPESPFAEKARFRPTMAYTEYILDPQRSIQIGSFQGRLSAWKYAFSLIPRNVFGILAGSGMTTITSIDSVYVRLLVNHGLIGLCFFAAIYVSILRHRNGPLTTTITLFFLANAFTMDGLIVSFRAMQAVIPVLCYAIVVESEAISTETALSLNRS